MSAVGTISSADRASFGDNRKPSWRVWVDLDNPHALPDTGPERPFNFEHPWAFDLPRDGDTPPCDTGDRVTVSTHGGHDVEVVRKDGSAVVLKSLAGMYDPSAVY